MNNKKSSMNSKKSSMNNKISGMNSNIPYMNTMKRFWCIIVLMLVCMGMFADNTADIKGFVHDNLTNENLTGTKVTLLKGDSIVSTCTADANISWMERHGLWVLEDIDVASAAEYVLLFEKEGYKDKVLPLSELLGKKPLKKGEERYVGDIALDKAPKTHVLNGVTVKATKVKFYQKGDTLVYDADAFQTAEGSMLDALIKQLPGVELNDNGEIFVNGRKVESLMLNGEHFFKGHNEVLLQNLPAYMVKHVKSYEKAGNMSQIMGKDMGDKELVMDVVLKKQYQIGWIGNVEGGLGSKDRYLARLFALRFTPRTRLAFYGNLNNLNDTRKPGENSSWTPDNMPSGLLATKKGGVDILLKFKDGLSKWEGNAEVVHTDLDSRTDRSGETFLNNGDVFSRARTVSKNRDFSLSTNHKLTLMDKMGMFFTTISPKFVYKKYNSLSEGVAMSFNQNPASIATPALIDSVYSASSNIARTVINRNLNNSKQDGHRWSVDLGNETFFKFDGLRQLSIRPRFSYAQSAADNWRQNQIDYPNAQSATTNAAATSYNNVAAPVNTVNRYTRTSPANKLEAGGELMYIRYLNDDINVRLRYDLGYNRTHDLGRSYMLNLLDGWDDLRAHPIGMLPSEQEYSLCLDRQNSEDKIASSLIQTPALVFAFGKMLESKADPQKGKKAKMTNLTLIIDLPVAFSHDRLDYTRAAYSGITRRNNAFFNPSLTHEIQFNNFCDDIKIHYDITHKTPSMVYALNILNDADPLNIYYGNEHLKNTTLHHATIEYYHHNQQKNLHYALNAAYDISHNDIAMGYVYDKSTGIRTYAPDNVSGNYRLSLDFNYYRPLDKKNDLTLENRAHWHMTHGVDLVGTDTGAAPGVSSVLSNWFSDRLKLDYKVCRQVTVGAKGFVSYAHSHSQRQDFDNVSLWDFNYGLTSLISLPLQFQLSTDFTIYSRRGYANSHSNTNDVVWNARLTKSFPKQGLTLALDGFDILGNLSNISYVLNSQGRTETYRNSLPRYVMFHAIFHFNRQPKKR